MDNWNNEIIKITIIIKMEMMLIIQLKQQDFIKVDVRVFILESSLMILWMEHLIMILMVDQYEPKVRQNYEKKLE